MKEVFGIKPTKQVYQPMHLSVVKKKEETACFKHIPVV